MKSAIIIPEKKHHEHHLFELAKEIEYMRKRIHIYAESENLIVVRNS